ncbi:hypothetical protein EVAR_23061_1 [Eumeta japonica]|uniref:Uncharacterized protein n=1 Tax=Eumeta variegata TaxID=151549 RepID=A0A4C1VL64_EUMVA|nr:hypothetical protein EVAR_23061_1 [Eumeta japonica]
MSFLRNRRSFLPRVFEFLYGVEIRLYRSKIILSPRRRGAAGGAARGGAAAANDRGGRTPTCLPTPTLLHTHTGARPPRYTSSVAHTRRHLRAPPHATSTLYIALSLPTHEFTQLRGRRRRRRGLIFFSLFAST